MAAGWVVVVVFGVASSVVVASFAVFSCLPGIVDWRPTVAILLLAVPVVASFAVWPVAVASASPVAARSSAASHTSSGGSAVEVVA